MKRLLFFALVVFAAWYGWHHYREILTRRPSHEAVIENHSGHEMVRVRLTVGGKTFVKESLPDEASVTFPFRVNEDASFLLEWNWGDKILELRWAGGGVPAGPMVQRHFMTVDADGAVIYKAVPKMAP